MAMRCAYSFGRCTFCSRSPIPICLVLTKKMIEKEQLLQLERPKGQCAECGAPLEELPRHPSRLRLRAKESERSDFCPDCWQFAKDDAYDSYWLTKRVKRERRAPRLSRREKAVAARALFESLWDQRDREDVDAHLYFLAHLLLRWGGLKFRKRESADEGERLVFENPATGEEIELRSVDADEASIQAIKERIENFLRDYSPEGEVELD